MKRIALLIALSLLPRLVLAAACCVGGNPKTFISLARLQTYEVGFSSSFRDVYARYDQYGDLFEEMKNQTFTMAAGAGLRLSENLQAALTVPWVYQATFYGKNPSTRAAVGDIVGGIQYTLLESLFESDWYPTISLAAGTKAPTGTSETGSGAGRAPGTGNGWWEPYLGVSFEKLIGPFTLALRANYAYKIRKSGSKDGDAIDLIESAAYPFSRQFSLAVGSAQNWVLTSTQDGLAIDDTANRVASVFATPTYFVDRFWSVSGGVDFSLPVTGFGVNQVAARSVTITTRYGFY